MNRVVSHGRHFALKNAAMPRAVDQLYRAAKEFSGGCWANEFAMHFDDDAKRKLNQAIEEYERQTKAK
jgi:hypothetical protein